MVMRAATKTPERTTHTNKNREDISRPKKRAVDAITTSSQNNANTENDNDKNTTQNILTIL